ncbi:hypothetical protein SAMN05421810_107116 [Amycolatopsis arida]|uniref:Uncharacterized protein n=1 Tax=Amycolatopsis arida TaxID=587909 RepID=A0A1I5YF71_9PSEU|nr:hypothetical protein [Amycolatopsis arida]TDX90472.1 hypothetical protein CLV69_107116 [Amycolatopsis arida]SFQ42856.1 hypothetical protein SAMN05421810_107116 [Amycolatopsis arida]
MTSVMRKAFGGRGGLARLLGALVLVGTAASQHPNPSFSRVQRIDIFSALFPNWRFFAPEPAQHDYHITYRVLDAAGEASPWRLVEVIAGRTPWQIAWFPGRRPEKAIFDICSELISTLDRGFAEIVKLPSYKMLREFIRKEVRSAGLGEVRGFQFALARHTGYDESSDPEIIFVSPYTPMVDAARTAPTGTAR